MPKPTVGVIGLGFVGGAVFRGFNLYADMKGYDANPKRTVHTLAETCACDYVFICLPSPMSRPDGGGADLSIIEGVCQQVHDLHAWLPHTVFILKSTVPIGTTARLKAEYDFPLIHNPEFLTARTSDIDFITASRIVLGGESELTKRAADLYRLRFDGPNIIEMTSDESEAVKYTCNCFFAVKVMFFNEMYLGLKNKNLDWNKVMAGVMSDGRIGQSHNKVPGHDGKFGYGGACFPKDICAMIAQLEAEGFDPIMLKACWEQNKRIRGIDQL